MPGAIRHRDLLHRLQSFETLTDAGVYVLAAAHGDQDHNAWQSAANIESATTAIERTEMNAAHANCKSFHGSESVTGQTAASLEF